jgi:hypothetical protein
MQHPDENTLEMFVLKAPSMDARRAAIEEHLHECEGCRILVGHIHAFYAVAAEVPEPTRPDGRTDSLPVSVPGLRYRSGMSPDDIAHIRRPMTNRVERFARTHPIATGAGTLVIVGLLGLAAIRVSGDSRDGVPAFVHINPGQQMVEVYNKSRVQLWRIPGVNLGQLGDLPLYPQSQRVETADIDGDGHMEVLSCVPLVGTLEGGHAGFSVFSESGELRRVIRFDREIRYGAVDYSSALVPTALVVHSRVDNQKRVFVSALNERSPMILAQIDGSGGVLGEYWHLGHLPLLLLADVDHDGKEEIVMGGVDDTRDAEGGRFPVIIVVDPEKLAGVMECASTPGFGKAADVASKYQIRLPVSDLEQALGAPGTVAEMGETTFNGSPATSFWVKQKSNGEVAIAFEYIFAPDMSILAVRSSGPSEILRERLLKEGKVRGRIDAGYLQSLALEVRYWKSNGWATRMVDGVASR